MSTFERTKEFHEKYGHPISDVPVNLSAERAAFRLKLIDEEFRELAEAYFPNAYGDWMAVAASEGQAFGDWIVDVAPPFDGDPGYYAPCMYEAADALADLEVVVNGTAVEHGFPMEALSREVFASNMSKDLNGLGKPIKGDSFFEPDIEATLLGNKPDREVRR